MSNNLQEYIANFSAILKSKIPDNKKEDLLKNMLEDIKFLFHNEFKDSEFTQEKQEAVKVIREIEKSLVLNLDQ